MKYRVVSPFGLDNKDYHIGDIFEVDPETEAKFRAKWLERTGTAIPIEETTKTEKKGFTVISATDLMKRKKDKSYIIQDFLLPKTVNMIYSPPGEYKSLIVLDACLSIVLGEPWLGLNTKQGKVLICDNENSDSELRNRLVCLINGHQWAQKRAKVNLNLAIRQGILDNDTFVKELHDYVQKNNISLLVFDTFRRFGNFEENSSDDANRLYAIFQKIINGTKTAILFLHHARKEGGTYRGSVDILGQVDTAYKVEKQQKSPNEFKLSCEKSRSGEIATIQGVIEWDKDKEVTTITRQDLSDKEKEDSFQKWKNTKYWALEKIQTLCPMAGTTFQRIKLVNMMHAENIDKSREEQLSKRTLERIITNLVIRKYLAQTGVKGEYRRLFSSEGGAFSPQSNENQ